MDFVICLPSSLSCCIIGQWIEVNDIARLDSAFCVKKLRPAFLGLLSSTECVIETNMQSSSQFVLTWLLDRQVKVEHFCISRNANVKLGIQYVAMFGRHVSKIVRVAGPGDYIFAADLLGIGIIEQLCEYGHLIDVECDNISVHTLNELLVCNPFLRRLCFSASRKNQNDILTDALMPNLSDLKPYAHVKIVMHLILLCPNLKSLDLHGFRTDLSDADFLTIAKQCRHLKAFAARRVNCSASAHMEMSKICCEIEILSLSGTMITDEAIECIAVNLKQLRQLDISKCTKLTKASLHSIVTHCASTLKLLWLGNKRNIASDAIIHLKSSLPFLFVHCLSVTYEDTIVPSAYDCAVCTVLRMYDLPFSSMIPIITQCKLLHVLSLFPTGGVSESTISETGLTAIINNCPHLHTIIVYDYEIATMRKLLKSVGRSITVIMAGGKENMLANLIEFPL